MSPAELAPAARPAGGRAGGLALLLGKAIDAVRVNVVHAGELGGNAVWFKRRRRGMGVIIAAGNLFLRWSRSRIRMFTSWRAWQAWEVTSFGLLHGSELAGAAGARRIQTRALPGRSLKRWLAAGELTTAMLRAAGEELRRAHALTSPLTGEPWSHGDPHLDNLLYDAGAQRARLIDFETQHEPADARSRHADDLLVVLLDLLGRARGADWLDKAQGFLEGYGQREVIAALPARLQVPTGLERVLWATRTDFAAAELLSRRLDALRGLTARIGVAR